MKETTLVVVGLLLWLVLLSLLSVPGNAALSPPGAPGSDDGQPVLAGPLVLISPS